MAPATATSLPSGAVPPVVRAPPMASAPAASGGVVSSAFIDRTKRFIDDNRAILLGLGVLAAGGILYYNYASSSSGGRGASGSASSGSGSGSGSTSSSSSSSKKNKKKNKKKNGAFLKGEGLDGPLLEEIKPSDQAQQQQQQSTKPASTAQGEKKQQPEQPAQDEAAHLEGIPDAAALASMSESDRNALGAKLKDRGNKLYSKKDFKKAVECYTKAIEVSIKRDAVFFSNRAACYTNYSPPEYEKCVADCDEALKLDHTYVKALKRRAAALENLGRDEEAVRDYTATTIIERFTDETAAAAVERCLKKVAVKKAKEIMESRQTKLPSSTFIHSYLSAFRPHAKPALPASPSQGEQTLDLAFDALAAADYVHALTLVNEAIEQGIHTKDTESEAYNLRGTFKFLCGDAVGAKADLEKSLDLNPSFVQSLVKIASVHMELGDPASAFGDFESAIRHNPEDPDIYYHRGQVYFIMGEFDKAIADYKQSTKLEDTFIFTHVQEAVAQYKLGNVASSMAQFRRILKQFPEKGEPSNYYGELLLDQQKFQESVERFDRSLELDKDRKPRNVLPLVNKSLAIFQWKQDIKEAEKLCKEALEIDAECDVAVATLAQLSLQQGKLDEAIHWFERSSELARTEPELVNAITYEQASRAQMAFLANYPEFAERLAQVAQQM